MSNTTSQKVITVSIMAYLAISPFVIGLCAYKWHDYKDKYVTLKINNQIDSLDRECDAVINEEKK